MRFALSPFRWVADEDGARWQGPAGCLSSLDLRGTTEAGAPGRDGAESGWAIHAMADDAPEAGLPLPTKGQIDASQFRKSTGLEMPADVTLSEAIGLLNTRLSDPTGQDRLATLSPKLGRYGVTMGHVGEVWAAPIEQLLDDRAILLERQKQIMRETKERSEKGEHSDPEFYRRLLKEYADNLKVAPSEISPDGKSPLPHGTRFDDPFTGGFNLTWSAVTGTITVSSNQAITASNPARYRASHDVGSANHEVGITFVNPASVLLSWAGVFCRYSAAADTGVGAYARRGQAGTVPNRIRKIVAGVETDLAAAALGEDLTASPWTIALSVDAADLITFFLRGSSSLTHTDATGAGNTRGGMWLRFGSGSPAADDWYIDDGVVVATGNPERRVPRGAMRGVMRGAI